ncbi:hypothetical protein ACROYT_G024785 [Oculina patagonica]
MLGTSNATSFKQCEYEYLHKCDEGFVAGFEAHPHDPDMGIYCNVFQGFADCLSSSSQCKGKFIDSYRYIILQRMIMDKTLGLCPEHDLEDFKEVVRADDKYRIHIEHLSGVDKDSFEPCAARIHLKCATQMQEEMKNGVKMCTSIKDFIKCYKNPGESCNAKIYKHFINVLEKYASKMLKLYKEHPGVMPAC